MKKMFKNFLLNEEGVFAVIFALSLPMVMASAGMVMDLSQAYLVRQRLGNALDAAALAGAASGTDEAEIREKVQAFFDANYPPEKIGTPYDLDVSVTEVDGKDHVSVSAAADFDTVLMTIFGYDQITVARDATIVRAVQGLEVAMVLDNTGSMSLNDNIGALRTASTNFINILFDAAGDPDDIKIGMIPYSSSVRIGRYGLGLNPDGTTYADGNVFVTLPAGVSYTTNHSSSTGWYGCVVEHVSTNYSATATHVTNSYGQLWRTGSSCSTQTNCRGHGWDGSVTTNEPYSNDIPDNYQGPWDIYMYGTVTRNCTGTCNPKYTFNKNSRPNSSCPWAYIQPLTSNQTTLLNLVSTMEAEGSTLSNVGMAWGYRILSPEAPFQEGVEWDDPDWKKAVIMMTDGETTMSNTYSAYWFSNKHTVDTTDLDDRMQEICTNLKDNNVTIYTVTFASDVPDSTKAAYRACATSDEHYFDAPTQDSLIETFEEIARQLANLHISH